MDEARYKLVFAGEVLPGFESQDVRKNLQALLSTDQKTLDQLFSGRSVVIRKYLTIDQIQPYEQAMIKAGAACRVVPVGDDGALAPRVAQPPARQSTPTGLLPRMGRVRFAAAFWPMVLLVLAGWTLPELMKPYLSPLLPGVEAWHLATAFFILAGGLLAMVTVRRLHDFNAGGWLSLLWVVPGVNCLLLLWLLVAPGTRSANRFGPPPRAAGAIAQPLGLWLPLLVFIAAGTYGALHYNELPQLESKLTEVIDWLENMLLSVGV